MKKCMGLLLLGMMGSIGMLHAQNQDPTRLVNVFIGTGGHGHTFPGASMPFGMVQLSPDTRMQGWDACGGYYYADSLIYGFSHTHLSGTGVQDYADILLMPSTGAYQWKPSEYRSAFSHSQESASPGYYSVMLQKHHIRVELTSTVRSGLQRYTFAPGTRKGNVLVDLAHGNGDRVIRSWIRVVNDSTILGLRESQGWARDQILYFALRFSAPFQQLQLAENDSLLSAKSYAAGSHIQGYFSFRLPSSRQLMAKVGLSAVSAEGALKNLQTEQPGFDFARVKAAAHAAWLKQLSEVDIEGGTHNQQVMFYTALYHSSLAPNVYQDVDGRYRSTDLKVHQAKGFTNYTVFSLWDTYRALNPLMTILQPARTADWINTFLAQYRYGGMTPIWELSGNETYCMIGHHSVPVIVDAYQKGIRGFDAQLALKAIENYDESKRFALPAYRSQGYLSARNISESTSRTLEYSYDDWCIAQLARMLGKSADYKTYIERAQYYKNVYDDSSGFFRGKKDAFWHSPFDPKEVNSFYTEANAWQYGFAAQQDVDGMIRLHGGPQAFATYLDSFFSTSSVMTGNVPPDIAGMIGQYAHGDEPSHHIAYLYDYVGMPWKTQALVHQICNELYRNNPDGESGNDDCGQMSAWLVMSAMGIYQVCPGNPEYSLGTPMFRRVVLHLPNGRRFEIRARNLSMSNYYIQAASLNGKAYPKSFITHPQLLEGGTLVLDMGPKPNTHWGVRPGDLPTSRITDDPIVRVPYMEAKAERFRDSMQVRLLAPDAGSRIRYTLDGSTPTESSALYNAPLMLHHSCTLKARAFKPGMVASATSQATFHRIAHDWSVKVLSPVDREFTAGGPDALIDGILQGPHYDLGGWQGYSRGDFEAVVDLKKERPIRSIASHYLQDIGVWIWYPAEVDYYVSEDGQNYTRVARLKNTVSDRDARPQVQTFSAQVHTRARYVKVLAKNYGRIPAWHPGAGNHAYVFVDELMIH